MKRLWILVFIFCLLLTGCHTPAVVPEATSPASPPESETVPLPEASDPLLTFERFPRMDGSTANLPLMAAVLSAATGLAPEEAEQSVDCSTTALAWERLASHQTDILLVYEAAEDTRALLDGMGTDLEITPIGLDALVFIVNEQNPVSGLTQHQLQQIYTGHITNWSELGGVDLAITAFQRDPTSGSQSLFRKLLLPDIEPMQAPTELIPGAMGELIEDLASYNHEGSALGYSVFYYASSMYTKPGLRFLAVDGVLPSNETIADQSYPLLNPFYVVIRADEPEDSPARLLRDWLLTEAGTQVIMEAGYIPYG